MGAIIFEVVGIIKFCHQVYFPSVCVNQLIGLEVDFRNLVAKPRARMDLDRNYVGDEIQPDDLAKLIVKNPFENNVIFNFDAIVRNVRSF